MLENIFNCENSVSIFENAINDSIICENNIAFINVPDSIEMGLYIYDSKFFNKNIILNFYSTSFTKEYKNNIEKFIYNDIKNKNILCYNCYKCKNCYRSLECKNCINCYKSYFCKDSKNLENCTRCSTCNDTKESINCDFCSDCIKCNNCKTCIKCKECLDCQECMNSKNLFDEKEIIN